MRVIHAYFGNGISNNVKLSREITTAGNSLVTNIDKLDELLNKEQTHSASVVGVYDFKEGVITLYSNNTFNGMIWLGKQKISGNWEYFS